MEPVIVITAKSKSTRLPNKNMLPVGDRPMAAWSLQHAKDSGLDLVLTTDIPELAAMALTIKATIVYQDPEVDNHVANIVSALERSNNADRPCILLQPTSPFRLDGILKKCIEAHKANPNATILTTRDVHRFTVVGGQGNNRGAETLWDGCVAIYPAGKVGDYSNVVGVRNSFLNSLQVDTEDDYVDACMHTVRIRDVQTPYLEPVNEAVRAKLREIGVAGEKVTLVVRPEDGISIPQEHCVATVNHCKGWDGGRLDVMFLISNQQLRSVGVSESMRRGVEAARLVIVRNHSDYEWLKSELPMLASKALVITTGFTNNLTNHISTGTIAHELLRLAGCEIVRYGFGPLLARATGVIPPWNKPGISWEIALLSMAGVDARSTYTDCPYGSPPDGIHDAHGCVYDVPKHEPHTHGDPLPHGHLIIGGPHHGTYTGHQ